MKTLKLPFAAIAISMALAVSFVACKKKNNTPAQDTDASGASDNTLAEKTADDMVNMAGQASENGSMSSYREIEDAFGLGCATVVYDSINKKITATFSGTCLDGHTRSGTLTFDYSQSAAGAKFYRNPGFKCVVTSTNYMVDGNQVNIVNKTITNTTPTPISGNLTWTVTSNINIVKAGGAGTISWAATKYKTLLNTSDTSCYHGQAHHITWTKAIIGITGNASGTTASNESFSANVTSQLVRSMVCSPDGAHPGLHPFINGNLDFTPGSKATRHIDYGYPNGGLCDDQALLTINSYTTAITVR
ncbi:MAG TPA: hypothetical protein VII99_04165 [Bacteroidia bacterium]